MDFKNVVINIQATGYDIVHTVFFKSSNIFGHENVNKSPQKSGW